MVHWDGKILNDIVGRSHVDRIAVLVSYDGTAKFLGAPKIGSGSGKDIAEAVYKILVDWNISERVVAASFDTTSTNTGVDQGACVLLSEMLGRKLINLACRHHIYEIVCKNVFEKKHGKTSGPETLIFNRFAKAWPTIKQNQFNHCFHDPEVRSKISDEECNQIKQFCQNQLQITQIRGDYEELLELVFTFLGGEARFMSKNIYCLKIYLFRSQFKLTAKELDCIRDFSIFVVKLYIRALGHGSDVRMLFSAPIKI